VLQDVNTRSTALLVILRATALRDNCCHRNPKGLPMAIPTNTKATGPTSTTIVYQPLGGPNRRIALVACAVGFVLLTLAAVRPLVTAASNTSQEHSAAQPTGPAMAATVRPDASEPIQPLDAVLGHDCGLACTDEIAALWRARTVPGADLNSIDEAFSVFIRSVLEMVQRAVVDAASAQR
jgi:hypothetical protein